MEELSDCTIELDIIVIGGLASSIMRYGPTSRRGFGPESKVEVGQGEGGEELVMSIRYHLTEPAKITLSERMRLVSVVENLVELCRSQFPETKVVYIGMFPRHVEKCCALEGHMTEDDPCTDEPN